MGEFTHMMRNPIRERDDRIHELESVLLRARNLIRELPVMGIPEVDIGECTRTLVALDKALMAQPVEPETAKAIPKCKSADCWLCHGVPENAGPR
jgi:hypothetical protein